MVPNLDEFPILRTEIPPRTLSRIWGLRPTGSREGCRKIFRFKVQVPLVEVWESNHSEERCETPEGRGPLPIEAGGPKESESDYSNINPPQGFDVTTEPCCRFFGVVR
jgi:hypothetical protein